MSKSALASLTAQYTDSENEDDGSLDSENSQASQVIIPKRASPAHSPSKTTTIQPPPTAVKVESTKIPRKKRSKKLRRLVSYQDDTLISDDDEEELSESSEEDSETESDESNAAANKMSDTPMEVDDDDVAGENIREFRMPESIEKSGKYAHYNFTLPPEPKGKPLPELVEKIKHLYYKMEQTNMDMNRVIQDRKEFRNPSIYEKLIQFCDINEFGTNYPPEIYDPLQWGPESYYEELAIVQKNEMVKRQKERKDTDKIEQATALARKVEEEAKKRKSKWDQPATTSSKQGIPQALTTTVTGTKGTVISAFGSLPKKPIA